MGYLQSLWMDEKGNMREDTDGDLKLDVSKDKIITFANESGEVEVHRYSVSAAVPYPDTATAGYLTVGMDAILPVWEAGKVLSNTAPADRNIYTTITGAEGDRVAFSTDNLSDIEPLLGVSSLDIVTFSSANIGLLGSDETTRATTLINYIRGVDTATLRPRTIGGKVWKLGDIVASTPIAISGAVENYHVVYSDTSYRAYVTAQKGRQTMVYAGGNDGMLHAFTSGQYNTVTKGFAPSLAKLGTQGNTVGDELWAYIPRAVLPHLKWLSDPDYTHSYFVDLAPKIFDAKIAGTAKDQWGTFLLLGLNMGGKDIKVDLDGDGTIEAGETLKPTYTLLDITDPTNPKVMWERSYEGLGMSQSMPSILKIGGNVYSAAGVLVNSGRDEEWLAAFGSGPQGTYAYAGISDQPGRMYVVDLRTGEPYDFNLLTPLAHDYLFTTSNNAVINGPMGVDRNLGYEIQSVYFGESIIKDPSNPASGWNGKAWSFDTYKVRTGTDAHGNLDPDTWPVSNNQEDWHLHLLMAELQPNPAAAASTISLGPITATMTASTDGDKNLWIYFGTGRYQSANDKTDTSQQYLFGIKDPLFSIARNYVSAAYNAASPAQVTDKAKFLMSADYHVDSGKNVWTLNSGTGAWDVYFGTFSQLVAQVQAAVDTNAGTGVKTVTDTAWKDGWARKLDVYTASAGPAERCVSQFALLGGGAFVYTYVPSGEACGFGGESRLYGLYYLTGTAYYLLGSGDTAFITVGVGKPPVEPPTYRDGTVFTQLSSGEITTPEIKPAFEFKSRIVNWYDE